MLTCEQLTGLVTDYIEGWLPMRQRFRFRLHVALCRSCRRYLRQMQLTIGALNGLPRQPLPPAKEQELMHRFRAWQRA